MRAVANNDQYYVVQSSYHFLVGKDAADLKAAVQCDAVPLLSKVVNVAPNEAAELDSVSASFHRSDIASFTGESDYFFVGVFCLVEVEEQVDGGKANGKTQTYRFVYDSVQMSANRPTHGRANLHLKVKFVFLWILLPGLFLAALVLLAVRFCFKRSAMLVQHQSFIEEVEARPGFQEALDTQGVTMKNLVSVTNMDPQPRPDEV